MVYVSLACLLPTVAGQDLFLSAQQDDLTGFDDVLFDYSWRFHFGDDPEGGPGPGKLGTCDLDGDGGFVSLGPAVCTGMDHDAHRFTDHDCRIACCYDPKCFVYQMDDGPTQCYHGGADAVCTSTNGTNDETSHPRGGQRTSVTPPRRDSPFAKAAFDDSSWSVVDLPHDFLINQTFADDGDVYHASLPRNVSWYRKHFHVPASWKGSTVQLHFEGAFHVASVYLNGQFLQEHWPGYTEFTVRLDNATGFDFGFQKKNVLAIRVDASFGSGHWYEGGGLYRSVHLQRMPKAHFVQHGVFLSPESDGTSAVASAEVELHGRHATSVSVTFDLFDGHSLLTSCTTKNSELLPDDVVILKCSLNIAQKVYLWSLKAPQTYSLRARLSCDGADERTIEVGFRQTNWTANLSGLALNGQLMKLRGFSHHNSFAGVGVVNAPRLNLFKIQVSRALGGNIFRMSHNPYENGLYTLLDKLGVLVWDENRDYGMPYVQYMGDMVKQHRNHPSIIMWSLCNEYECKQLQDETGFRFREVALSHDTTRPLTANGDLDASGDCIVDGKVKIEIQGHSHSRTPQFRAHNEKFPGVPQLLSECCSCKMDGNQRLPMEHRAVDADACQKQSKTRAEEGIPDQNGPGLLPYVAGSSGVWTLFEYFGESHGWPQVASFNYGQMDIAGFPKPHAYWYRTNWMARVPESDPGRPPSMPSFHVARILSLGTRYGEVVKALVSTASAELLVDGTSLGRQSGLAGQQVSWAVPAKSLDSGETEEPFVENITLLALDEAGDIAQSHTVLARGEPDGLRLSVDVPSPMTGTGERLLLDGHDVALLRLEMLDAKGRLAALDNASVVSFEVASGPGRLVGIGNGDPFSHRHQQGSVVDTYGGIARAIVQASVDCVTPNRERIAAIDADPAAGQRTQLLASCPTEPIIVLAKVRGMIGASVEIPVSGDATVDGPEAVAARSVALDSFEYIDEFSG